MGSLKSPCIGLVCRQSIEAIPKLIAYARYLAYLAIAVDCLVFEKKIAFLPHDARHIANYAVARCLSVCPSARPSVRLSVTRQYSVEKVLV